MVIIERMLSILRREKEATEYAIQVANKLPPPLSTRILFFLELEKTHYTEALQALEEIKNASCVDKKDKDREERTNNSHTARGQSILHDHYKN